MLVEPEVEQDEEEEKIDLKGKGKAGVKGKGKTESSGMVSAKTKAALAWVQNVLDLKDKFDMLLIEAFETDKSMEKAINDVSTHSRPWMRGALLMLFFSLYRLSSFSSIKIQSHLNIYRCSWTRISRKD